MDMVSKLTLKEPSKIAADNTFIFVYFYCPKKIMFDISKKIRLDISCESSAQREISSLIFSEKH